VPSTDVHISRPNAVPVALRISSNAANALNTNDLNLSMAPNGIGQLMNFEDERLLLGTNNATRIRVENTNNNIGITWPGSSVTYNYPSGATRIAIPEAPNLSLPLSNNDFDFQALSLLHLGFLPGNLNLSLPNNVIPSAGGYRKWMDIGALIAAGSDNMYVGLYEQAGSVFPGDGRSNVRRF
jgi:hypothetical protein